MKKYAIALCAALPLLVLGGCWGTAVNTVNNDLATLAKYDIPTACTIIGVAEGYFTVIAPNLSAAEIADEAKAAKGVKVVCDNPPTNVNAAFVTLMQLWTAIQNDTTIPTSIPTSIPIPSPTASP